MSITLTSLAIVVSLGLAPQDPPRTPPSAEYVVFDLGTLGVPDLGTSPGSYAAALDNHGVVVGHSVVDEYAEDLRAFVRGSTGMYGLPPVGGDPHSLAVAINAHGQVAGISMTLGEGTTTAVLWTDGVPAILGEFHPRGLSNDGRVVGERPADWTTLESRPVIWSQGVLTDLGDLGGGHGSAAAVVGARVVGTSTNASGDTRAFLWQGGPLLDLGTLGGAWSQARDLDVAGRVVGTAETASGLPHAFLFQVDPAGAVLTRTDLGVLGADASHAYGIGDDGTVVGTSDARAFRWRAGDGLVDLNTRIPASSGWHLERATAVNGAGQIVGSGMHDGLPRAYLLTPRVRRAGDRPDSPVK